MRPIHTLIVLPLLLAGMAGAAEMFRWVDAEGKVHYTDTAPPPTAKNVQPKNLGDKPAEGAQLPYALRLAKRNFPVTFYNSECGDPCSKAKALLAKRGIPLTEKNPEKSAADNEALKKIIGRNVVVPVLIIGTDILKGFEEGRWNGALDLAGYPKDSLLPKSAALPTPPATPTPATDKSAPEAVATPPSQSPPQP